MLIEFSCSNHKSIKDKITFSALASKDTSHSDCLLGFEKYKFDRTMAIYGANGSGKSNFLSAIAFAKYLVCNSIQYQPGQLIEHNPHKLSSDNTPSIYQFHFVESIYRFAYGFSLLNGAVLEEYLYCFNKGRRQKIFERKYNEISLGSRYTKQSVKAALSVLKENRLFLSCLANFSPSLRTEIAFRFFSDDIVYYNPEESSYLKDGLKFLQQNSLKKEVFLCSMQKLGTGIKDLKISFSSDMHQNLTTVVYDNFETRLETEESTGIKKLVELVALMMDVLRNDKILLADNLDVDFHEAVIQYVVNTFNKAKANKKAQLVFTTHDVNLLDNKLFRRDQIWFTELNDSRSTELFSLLEFRNVAKSDDLKKDYLNGTYGAIPCIKLR